MNTKYINSERNMYILFSDTVRVSLFKLIILCIVFKAVVLRSKLSHFEILKWEVEDYNNNNNKNKR